MIDLKSDTVTQPYPSNARGDRPTTPAINQIRYKWVKLGLNAATDRCI